MKIGVDARILGRRGVGRYLKNLLTGLSELRTRHEFTLFLGPRSDLKAFPERPGFRFCTLPQAHPAWAEQVLIPRLGASLGLDLLHFADNTGPLRSRLPFVLTLHDGMWRRPLKAAVSHPTLSQRLQDRYRKWVCPAAARRARAIFTDSEFSKADLVQDLGLEAAKMTVTPLAADPFFDRRQPEKEAQAALAGLGIAGPFVLCSGASDTRKNIDRLIFALARARKDSPRLAKATLVVTSLRPGELATTRYEESVKQAGLAGQVKFMGYLSDDQLKALYQRALCFAFPSLWEGFGLPVLEAFAMGCPVLCSNTTSLPEVAGKAAQLVDPAHTGSIAAGLIEISKPATARRLAAAGKKRKALFSWKAVAGKTLAIYEEVGLRLKSR